MDPISSTNDEKPRFADHFAERLAAVEDPLAFVKNKSSDNARKLCEVEVSLATHIWIDKHYHDRHQFGDDVGKREGINPELVEKLVRKAIPHLLFYSTVVQGFIFLNFGQPNPKPVKVVLQEVLDEKKLNVVIEAHYTGINKFEITVKTAMSLDDFRLYQGQYAIEIQEDSSILLRKDNNKVVKVCEN